MCLKGQTCLCNVHVSTATRAIAIWGLSLNGVLILSTVFFHKKNEDNQINSIVKALNIYWIMIAVNLSLLLGCIYKKPFLHWPYLILQLCMFLFLVIFIAGVVFFGSVAVFVGDQSKFADSHFPLDFLNQHQQVEQAMNSTTKPTKSSSSPASIQLKLQMLLLLALISAIFVCVAIVHAYFLTVVMRAYSYLKTTLAEQSPTNQLELYEQKY